VRTNTLILFLATEAIQTLSVRFSRRQKQWSNESKPAVGCFIIIIMTGEFIYSAALMAVTILHVGRRKDFDNGPMEST
jgi:hypothetical protein